MNTLIGISLIIPAKRSRDKAKIRRLRCGLVDPFENCPVLALGQCITRQFLARSCVYGRASVETGWTRRAQKYCSWVAAAKEKVAAGPKMPTYPDKRLAVVGDHVWLPYPQMSMCEAVPFLAHSHFLASGHPFIKFEDFTPEVIITLVEFRPYALMGGKIRSYQKDSVPQFLYDLKHLCPRLYESAADMDSVIIERTPDPGRFKSTPVPIGVVKPGVACSVVKHSFVWDGKRVTFECEPDDLKWAWKCGKGNVGPITVSFEPTPDLPVLVEDEEELRRLFEAGVFALKPA